MKRLINISGGAIKYIGLIACLRELVKEGVRPTVLTGVSSGAIISFCYVCGKLEQAFKIGERTDDIRVIFSKKNDPTRKWNIIRNILLGRNYLGIMDNLEKNIRAIVSPDDFYMYKHGKQTIDCFILSVNEDDGSEVLVNLKDLDYDQAIDHVIGSSSISPTTIARSTVLRGRKINLIDGGHRDHSAGGNVLELDLMEFDECLTIWSRDKPSRYVGERLKDLSTFFKRLINSVIPTFVKEVSMNDEEKEDVLCAMRAIEYYPIYLKKFHSSTYKISKEEIKKGIQIGVTAARKYIQKIES